MPKALIKFGEKKYIDLMYEKGEIRAISKWMNEWAEKGILIYNLGTTIITSYSLRFDYSNLKISDLGFIERTLIYPF